MTLRGPERGKETLPRSQQQEGQTLNALDLPLSFSLHWRPAPVLGPGDTLSALSVSHASGLPLVGVQCLWGVWSGLWGCCLIQRTIPSTHSDGRLCSGITNREIKGMLRSYSGKIKCACTRLFRSELKLVLQGCNAILD